MVKKITIIIDDEEYRLLGDEIFKVDRVNTLPVYDPCKGCSNHPNNGGSGICL